MLSRIAYGFACCAVVALCVSLIAFLAWYEWLVPYLPFRIY